MDALNLPVYEFKIKKNEDFHLIWDELRRKYVKLTPEEWVRQNFIQYLILEKNYVPGYISVEKQIIVNGNQRRFDILVYKSDLVPALMIECKSPDVKITDSVFEQIAMYNIVCKVKFLIVTNGLTHFCCFIDFEKKTFKYLREIPDFKDI
ncbi:MAG: type I restriction enzyme HsdR N-terminal domain-containing protein [Bacteroidota bacterium]